MLLMGCVGSNTATPLDSTQVTPTDTIAYTNPDLTYKNGAYQYDGEPFSGVVHRVLKGYAIESYSSVLQGRLHGAYSSYYASGKPYEIRTYHNGLSTGTHTGYWEDSGLKKFEYNYQNQKKEGRQRSWYANGDPAEAYTCHDDRLDGLQQAGAKTVASTGILSSGTGFAMDCKSLKPATSGQRRTGSATGGKGSR